MAFHFLLLPGTFTVPFATIDRPATLHRNIRPSTTKMVYHPYSHTAMTKPLAYNYPPGTTPEAIEAFRTIYGQTPEDDIRLGTTFEIFLKGYVCGRNLSGNLDPQVRVNDSIRDEIDDLTQRIEDLERFKEATVSYDSYGNYARFVG